MIEIPASSSDLKIRGKDGDDDDDDGGDGDVIVLVFGSTHAKIDVYTDSCLSVFG